MGKNFFACDRQQECFPAQQYWAEKRAYRLVTAEEMAQRFRLEFPPGIAEAARLDEPFDPDSQRTNVTILSFSF